MTAHRPENATSSTKGQGLRPQILYSSTHIADLHGQTMESAIRILSNSKLILPFFKAFGTRVTVEIMNSQRRILSLLSATYVEAFRHYNNEVVLGPRKIEIVNTPNQRRQ